MSNTSPVVTPIIWCFTSAQQVPSDHRCPACGLQGDLQRANADISQLRRELARVSAQLTRSAADLCNEREAHAITNRRLENVSGQRDAITEAFDAARETVAKLEAERDARMARADATAPTWLDTLRTAGLI